MIPAITSPGHRDCVTRVSACDFQEAPLSLSWAGRGKHFNQTSVPGPGSEAAWRIRQLRVSRSLTGNCDKFVWHQTWNETMFCKIFSKMEKLGNCSILAARSAGAVTSVTQARVESGPGPSAEWVDQEFVAGGCGPRLAGCFEWNWFCQTWVVCAGSRVQGYTASIRSIQFPSTARILQLLHPPECGPGSGMGGMSNSLREAGFIHKTWSK